jgi:hypothetical protein
MTGNGRKRQRDGEAGTSGWSDRARGPTQAPRGASEAGPAMTAAVEFGRRPPSLVVGRGASRREVLWLQRLAGNRAVVGLPALRAGAGGPPLGHRVQRDGLKDALDKAAATHTGGDLGWFEQILTAPGNTAESFQQESPETILETLKERGCEDQTVETIKKMTFGGLLKILLEYRVITQSCGQTAALVHGIVSPSSVKSSPEEKNLDALVEVVKTSSAQSDKDKVPWYVRVEGGGHAFVIEVSSGLCRIYQSFIGTSTLASDLAADRSFSLSDFCSQLKVALTSSKKGETVAKDVTEARRGLFASQAVHPDDKFQVQAFPQEEGIGERLTSQFKKGTEAWASELGKPATSVLKAPSPSSGPTTTAPSKPGTSVTVPITAVYDADTYETVPSSKLLADKEYALLWEGSTQGAKFVKQNGQLFEFTIV